MVWVGYDDNRDLDLEGARSALPIWTEFMKKAVQFRHSAQHLPGPPKSVVSVMIDPYTGLVAGPDCTARKAEYFLQGSAPTRICSHIPVEDPEVISDLPFRTDFTMKPVETIH